MATWDTYDFDKACEDASWYWLTLGSPAITPNQNKSNTQSVFNQMVDQSCYNAFMKGGIAFAQNWVDCAARRYAAKLSQFGKTSDPAFPSAWMYEIHVKARMWIAINRAQKDMAASAAPAPEPTTISKVSLATQARQITALPGQTTARQPAEPSDPFAAIRAAASMPVPITAPAPAPSTSTSFISRIASMAAGLKTPTPIVVAPVPMPGVTPQPSWPEEEGAPQSDEPIVFKPTDITPVPGAPPLTPVDFRELRTWEGFSYYVAGKEMVAVLAELLAEAPKAGIGIIEQASSTCGEYVVLAKATGVSPSSVLPWMQQAQSEGFALLMEEVKLGDDEGMRITKTRSIGCASNITMSSPKAFVYNEPSAGWLKPGDVEVVPGVAVKDKTLLIGGVVVGVLALGGVAYYFSTRKPAPMRANASEKPLTMDDIVRIISGPRRALTGEEKREMEKRLRKLGYVKKPSVRRKRRRAR